MTLQATALVFDGHTPAALAVIRNLGRRGVVFRTLDAAPSDYGISRYVKDAVLTKHPGDDALLEALLALSDGRPVLFPTSSAHVDFMARHFSLLKDHFRFPAPTAEALSSAGLTALFRELMPPEKGLNKAPDQLVIDIATTLGFPCLIKSRHGKKEAPIQYIQSAAAFSRALEKIEPADFYAERYVPGEACDNYTASLYYAEAGELSGFVTAQVLRQYPEFVGEATYLKQKWIPELIGLVHPRLKASGFRGIFHAHFKRDEFTRKVYITGVSASFSPETELYTHLGFETPYLYYLDSLGEDVPKVFFQSDTNCHFLDGWRDMAGVAGYIKTGHMGLMKILGDYKFRKVPATWAWDDMGPGLNKLGAEAAKGAKILYDKLPFHQ
ncbi:hypothetical protein [Peptoniphilus sp. EMRHCC_23]|uniref:hypothetical protein n=1 Tax=Peptoniphilus rachelemmaiella TaxID=2811779 RepID=UPI001C00891F|nr:hypothetical protein [Peptoniphilus rachelemmaiella]